MTELNNRPFTIVLRQGTLTNLELATTYLTQGEPVYTTDTKQVFVGDGTNKLFVGGPEPINTQTANYVLAMTDLGGIVEMNLAGANTVTVPANATVAFPLGTRIMVIQAGAGQTTIVAAGGVTLRNAGALAAQWNAAWLYKRGTDEWVMTIG